MFLAFKNGVKHTQAVDFNGTQYLKSGLELKTGKLI